MISFLVPTRGRPERLSSFVQSVLKTADNPDDVEFIVRIDDDDNSYDAYSYPKQVKIFKGKRKTLSECYEWERSSGEILVLGGDDVIFHTKGWDTKVKEVFAWYPDKIVLVHGDDGDPNKEKTNATMPFIHKNWIKSTGQYLPPYFSGDFCDTWLSDLANAIDRRIKIDILTEHIHPAFGKREQDQTDKEKWEKHFRDNMAQRYLDTLPERQESIRKLQSYIEFQSRISYDIQDCELGHTMHETMVVYPAFGQMTVFNYPLYISDTRYGFCPGRDIVSDVLSKEQYWEKRLFDSPVKQILHNGNRDNLVIDVGCHIGWYTRVAHYYGYKVIAFDANEENLRLCRINVPQADIRKFLFNEKITDRFQTDKTIELLKIDIEGFEKYAIMYFENVLLKVNNILLEVSPIFNNGYPALLDSLKDNFEILEHTGEPFSFNFQFTQKDLWLRRRK